MIGIMDLVLLFQKDKEVNVRQPLLLKLYSEDIAVDISEQPILDIFEHSLYLLKKDMCHNIRTVRGSLTFSWIIWIVIIILIREHIIFNLRPTGVCCHSNEEVRFTAMLSYGH